MVDIQSTGEVGDRPNTRGGNQAQPDSVFKQYLEQNPEMADKIFKVML